MYTSANFPRLALPSRSCVFTGIHHLSGVKGRAWHPLSAVPSANIIVLSSITSSRKKTPCSRRCHHGIVKAIQRQVRLSVFRVAWGALCGTGMRLWVWMWTRIFVLPLPPLRAMQPKGRLVFLSQVIVSILLIVTMARKSPNGEGHRWMCAVFTHLSHSVSRQERDSVGGCTVIV